MTWPELWMPRTLEASELIRRWVAWTQRGELDSCLALLALLWKMTSKVPCHRQPPLQLQRLNLELERLTRPSLRAATHLEVQSSSHLTPLSTSLQLPQCLIQLLMEQIVSPYTTWEEACIRISSTEGSSKVQEAFHCQALRVWSTTLPAITTTNGLPTTVPNIKTIGLSPLWRPSRCSPTTSRTTWAWCSPTRL